MTNNTHLDTRLSLDEANDEDTLPVTLVISENKSTSLSSATTVPSVIIQTTITTTTTTTMYYIT